MGLPPGWAAIAAALRRLYGGEPAFHVAPTPHRRFGGPVALEGLSGYQATTPPPHLHLVTFGLSELYDKVGRDPAVSGWGIELTCRVAGLWTAARPQWAVQLLGRMANQVDERRDPFRPGDRIDTGAPLSPDVATRLTAIAVVADPQLGEIDTVNGRVQFLQAVGLTADELELARRWRTSGVVAALAERDPLLLTVLDRPSVLEDPDVRARLEEQARREGPS